MEEGFKQRARLVETLLSDDQTSFVLVVSPQKETILEDNFLRSACRTTRSRFEQSSSIGCTPGSNSMNPRPRRHGRPQRSGSALVDYVTNLGQLASSAREDRRHLHELREATEAPIVYIRPPV